jgi:hypothetical protein
VTASVVAGRAVLKARCEYGVQCNVVCLNVLVPRQRAVWRVGLCCKRDVSMVFGVVCLNSLLSSGSKRCEGTGCAGSET